MDSIYHISTCIYLRASVGSTLHCGNWVYFYRPSILWVSKSSSSISFNIRNRFHSLSSWAILPTSHHRLQTALHQIKTLLGHPITPRFSSSASWSLFFPSVSSFSVGKSGTCETWARRHSTRFNHPVEGHWDSVKHPWISNYPMLIWWHGTVRWGWILLRRTGLHRKRLIIHPKVRHHSTALR